MRARDLAEQFPTVSLDDQALDAARLLAEHRLPGLLVVDASGRPRAILPASQLVRLLVPGYVIEDPALAAVIDEAHADRLCDELAGVSVGECLPRDAPAPAVADADDTAVEVAALMARARSPLVAVVERAAAPAARSRGGSGGSGGGGGELLGVITASHLLHRLLGNA
ncbi:CBS domain-containing protein [Kitasatospora purpeofusca]|uniref:CBS domain-containing protein n=1 Tax=Kitasatospora purpeofusca TaxID=67352 RepID=UPI002A5AE68F|nr:CBS domain-containing protein [Kitasatospora purpeofusca]MDY0809988.1 CBS domain-containing protein [Kitasatospora purpeofusca]